MSSAPNVSVGDVATFLGERFGEATTAVEYVGEGYWSRCFGFMLDSDDLVIRIGDQVGDFRVDEYAGRLAAPTLPIPDVREIGQALGSWYAISERKHGTAWEQLTTEEWAQTLPSILSTLDALHAADVSESSGFGLLEGGSPFGSWRDYLASVGDDPPGRRISGWLPRLMESPGGDRGFRAGYKRMMELADAFEGPRSIVHNDLLNRNALAAGGQVTALFDWGCAIYGDFVYELAAFILWNPWHPVIAGCDVRAAAEAHFESVGLVVADFDARLQCSLIHLGLAHFAFNAYVGDFETLRLTEQRTLEFLD